MKLGEIKLQALKMMKLDPDVNYTMFELDGQIDGGLYSQPTQAPLMGNPNTREKLIRMNDVINRGLTEYYELRSTPHEIQATELKELKRGMVSVAYVELSYLPIPKDLYDTSDVVAVKIHRIDVINRDGNIEKENITFRQLFSEAFEKQQDDSEETSEYIPSVCIEGVSQYIGRQVLIEYSYASCYIKSEANDRMQIDNYIIPLDIQMALPYYITSELSDIPEERAQAQSKWAHRLRMYRPAMETSHRRVKSIMRR